MIAEFSPVFLQPAYDFLQYNLTKRHKISQVTVKIIVRNIKYMEATETRPQTDYPQKYNNFLQSK